MAEFETRRGWLFGLAYRLLGSVDETEDAVQAARCVVAPEFDGSCVAGIRIITNPEKLSHLAGLAGPDRYDTDSRHRRHRHTGPRGGQETDGGRRAGPSAEPPCRTGARRR